MSIFGSRIVLWISGVACAVAASALLVGSIGFSNIMEGETVRGIIVADNASSVRGMSFVPIRMQALGRTRREEILKKLIIQYIVKRYSITGSAAEEWRVFGTGLVGDMSGAELKIASLSAAQTDYGQPFASLAADREERERLLSEGITRTVEIVGAPTLYKDMWITEVEFINRTPGVWRMAEANREAFEIHMVLEPIEDLRLASSAVRLGIASVIFDWHIKNINRVRK